MDILEDLKWRGAINQETDEEGLRQLQTKEQVKHNVASLTAQVTKLFGGSGHILFVNNYDWLSKINLLDFL